MKKIKAIAAIVISMTILVTNVYAQGAAGNSASFETQKIVDMPTAGMITKGNYSVNTNIFTPGGIALDFSAGLFKNFSMGVAFSGTGIIGRDDMSFQKIPGFNFKFRFIDEQKSVPAIAFGFNSQGRGAWMQGAERFETMSPGFFLAASKNFVWSLGDVAAHFGINYSVEPSSANKAVNFYIGAEQSIASNFAINMEFNFNQDEKKNDVLSARGTLNTSFRYSITKGVTLELELRDLLQNRKNTGGGQLERRLNLEIVRAF